MWLKTYHTDLSFLTVSIQYLECRLLKIMPWDRVRLLFHDPKKEEKKEARTETLQCIWYHIRSNNNIVFKEHWTNTSPGLTDKQAEEFQCSYLSRLHTDLLWWVFYDLLLSTLVSLYWGPLASLWHPIQQATKQLIRAPLGRSPWKALIWYFQGIPEPQQCIHTAPMHAWLGSLLWPFIVHGAQQCIRITEGEPTCLLSCGKSQKPDANGKLMGLKHCTLPERGNCWLIKTTWIKALS